MLDNFNNSSPTRSSRTPYRPPLHLPKSPLSPGNSNGVTSGDLRMGNGRESGDARTHNGGSSPDSVDLDIRRRVELLEKASCKNLAYNINRASRSPRDGKVDENVVDGRSYPIRNFTTVQSKEINLTSEKEIITLDSDGSEKGSPIPVMKLLNPEFRAMLGKTAKISPHKQFGNEFGTKEVSPLARRENGEQLNGAKNINLKTILTHDTTNGNTPKKVVNINVIVSKNVNKTLDVVNKNVNSKTQNNIQDVSDDETLTATNGDDLLNCRNNNVQRHRELIENNINASMNLTGEGNVHRIRNDLERNSVSSISSGSVSRESSKERDVLVKQVTTASANVNGSGGKDNIEKSQLESSERVKDSSPGVNSKEPVIPPTAESTHIDNTRDTKDRIEASANSKDNDSHSKDNEPNERNTPNPLGDMDDAFNGNLVEANRSAEDVDIKKTMCQTFIDNEQAFESLTSVMPETLQSVSKDSHIEAPSSASSDTEISTDSGVPQGSIECPIPINKTETHEQTVHVSAANSSEDSTDSVSIATKSPVKDGVYYKGLLNEQREVLAQFLSTFESILSAHEQAKSDMSCTDSATPCVSPTETAHISLDVEGQILLTVGQCKLLLNKKFPFFEKNCNKSLSQAAQPVDPESEELQILNEDLTGLWDTICIQIDEVKEKFETLTQLRDNNWVPDVADAPAPKINSLKMAGMKRGSLGGEKRTIPRGVGSKSTSALPPAKAAKNEVRKKFLEEKRKAMLAERRREMKKTGEESGDVTGELVQFL